MKRFLWGILTGLLAILLVGGAVVTSRQRSELLRQNRQLRSDVQRLTGDLAAAGPHAGWKAYENTRYGFEFRYPPQAFFEGRIDESSMTSRGGLPGVILSQTTGGCSIEVYVGPADGKIDPFDERGVDPKSARYVASTRLDFGSLSYHVGLSVVSHAVDATRSCIPLFKQIVPTFRFVPAAHAGGRGSVTSGASAAHPALSSRESARLRTLGLSDPEADLRTDLARHSELIPYAGVLGGKQGFHDPSSIILLPYRWVYAAFDDGHVEGHLVAAWEVAPGGKITWEVVASECPGCSP